MQNKLDSVKLQNTHEACCKCGWNTIFKNAGLPSNVVTSKEEITQGTVTPLCDVIHACPRELTDIMCEWFGQV